MNAEASIAYSPGLANGAMKGVDDEHHKDTKGVPKKTGTPKLSSNWTEMILTPIGWWI